MATITQILADILLRYRHAYTNAQVVTWMNKVQYSLFEDLEIDDAPYNFTTIADTFEYALGTVDIDRIKVMTIQIDDSDPATFQEVPFKRNDNNQYASESEYWYSIVNTSIYLNVPGGAIDDREVYIYLDESSSEISSSDLDVEPATPKRYQELLTVGTLKYIAQSRRDVTMANNYDAEYETMMTEVQWKMKMSEPEFVTPIDTLPRRWGWGDRTLTVISVTT